LNGVAPCSLLNDVQIRKLGVGPGKFSADSFSGATDGDGCIWTNYPNEPDDGYTAGRNGAELAYGNEPLRTVDGFAATTTFSLGTDLPINA